MDGFSTADIIGTAGVVIVLIAYFLLQMDKLTTSDFSFSLLNAGGSLLILYSLLYHWNFASVLIEVVWILISFIGIYKNLSKS